MYKTGDKFVIEIGEKYIYSDFTESDEQKNSPAHLYRIKGFNSLTFDKNELKKLEKYEPYSIFEEASYEKGLNDAWECMSKIYNLPYLDNGKIFGKKNNHISDIVKNLTPQEAIEKLKAWEKEQEIQVGDVVSIEYKVGEHVVTWKKSKTGTLHCMSLKTGSFSVATENKVEKTGKRIDLTEIFNGLEEKG